MRWKDLSKPVKTGIIVVIIFLSLVLIGGLFNLIINKGSCVYFCTRGNCYSNAMTCFVNNIFYSMGPFSFIIDLINNSIHNGDMFLAKIIYSLSESWNFLIFLLMLFLNSLILFFIGFFISKWKEKRKKNKIEKN
jgi:hypothetical protein